MQNYKKYAIPPAQLIIADVPYNIGNNFYGSNPMWYIGGDNKNGESKLAKKAAFNSDFNFNLYEYFHFCSKMLKKEPKKAGRRGRSSDAPCMIVFCSFEQMSTLINAAKKHGFNNYIPLVFVKNYSPQVLKANMRVVGASDSLVRTFQSQESNLDFKETVRACFSELCTLSDSSKKKINPLTFSLRTLRICLVLMEDGISPDCSLKWSRGGMMQNGRCSTPKISECHKTEKGVSLSDILEAGVPQKYFLSKEQVEKIVFR